MQLLKRQPRRAALTLLALVAAAVFGCSGRAMGDVITISGAITQSVPENLTGPAANNPSLNAIHDGNTYTVTLSLAKSITAPGLYDLTGDTLLFSVPSASASESSVGSITLVISNLGAVDDITLLACLTTGTACDQGNELSAIFEILAASLNASTPATGLDPPHPLDLLEDDGITDIHGSISRYSYTGSVSAVPEPSSAVLLCTVLAAIWAAKQRFLKEKKHQ